MFATEFKTFFRPVYRTTRVYSIGGASKVILKKDLKVNSALPDRDRFLEEVKSGVKLKKIDKSKLIRKLV